GAMADPPGTGPIGSRNSDRHHSFPSGERRPLMVTRLSYPSDRIDERRPLYGRPGPHRPRRQPTAEARGTPPPDQRQVPLPAGAPPRPAASSVLKQWENSKGISLASPDSDVNEDIITKTAAPPAGSYDLASPYHGTVKTLILAGLVQPIRVGQMQNWTSVIST